MHRHVARSGRASHIPRGWARATIALVLALAGGCSDEGAVVQPDGGDAPGSCPGTVFCDGLSLRACNNGVPGNELANCEGAGGCSRERCTSAACAEAERDHTTFRGCVFYTAQVDNVTSDAARATSFLFTNGGSQTATVTLQHYADGSWNFAGEKPIPGQGAGRLSIAGLAITNAGVWSGGLRILSDQPVTVAQIESDDGDRRASSSGGTMLLPIQALGTRHMVMAYPQVQTPAVAATPNSVGGAGRLIVVGTKAKTRVEVTVAETATLVVAGTLPGVAPGPMPFMVDLDEGQVFQAWSGDENQDLTGTEVFATAPVAVFSGNISTTYGRTAEPINSPDMAHEQIPPIAHWSTEWVGAALPPQALTCDTLLGEAGSSLWRLLSGTDANVVTFTSPDPSNPVHADQTLHAGQVIEFLAKGDFVVKGTGPLLLTQGIDCEPSLSLAISADKLLEDLTFSILPSFEQTMAVVRKGTEPVLLDGSPLSNTLFSPAVGGYQVARVPLAACAASQSLCTYRLQGHFGFTLRGMDVLSSYALTATAWAGCIDPLVSCVD